MALSTSPASCKDWPLPPSAAASRHSSMFSDTFQKKIYISKEVKDAHKRSQRCPQKETKVARPKLPILFFLAHSWLVAHSWPHIIWPLWFFFFKVKINKNRSKNSRVFECWTSPLHFQWHPKSYSIISFFLINPIPQTQLATS